MLPRAMNDMTAATDLRIIDGHCHLASSHCTPDLFFRGVARNAMVKMASQGMHVAEDKVVTMMKSQHSDHFGDTLVEQMDEAGISSTVLLAPDFTYVMDSDYSIEDIAQQHFKVLDRHPGRFHLFQGIDPRWEEKAYDFFDTAVAKNKVHGLKLYPPCGFSPSDQLLYPLYEICERFKLPVLLHTGPTSPTLDFSFAEPKNIDRAAKDFPNVNFILAHAGINNVEQGRQLCHYRPNVYLDISGFPASTSPGGWKQQLKELFESGINHKIIFGTDWPVFSQQQGLHKLIEQLLDKDGPFSGIPQQEVQWIMAENIEFLLGLKK